MLRFPSLKTGVIAQHPLAGGLDRPVRIFTFLDGKEQRFPVRRGSRRWVVRLDQLDEREAAAVEAFVRTHLLTLEPFEFIDPATGEAHSPCRLAGDVHEIRAGGPGRVATALVIVREGE